MIKIMDRYIYIYILCVCVCVVKYKSCINYTIILLIKNTKSMITFLLPRKIHRLFFKERVERRVKYI